MQNAETPGRPYDHARRALDELERRGLSPSAESFAVLSAYFAGEHPVLSARLGAMLEDSSVTAEALNTLYLEHLSTSAADPIEVTELVGRHTQEAADALAEAAGHAARYEETLDQSANRLRTSSRDEGWRDVVNSLMRATTEMRTRTEVLERRLNTTHDEIVRLQENLIAAKKESRTDALTGLVNRKGFDESLAAAGDRARNGDEPLCLILCDIDHFKSVNDRWGHAVGDQVIKYIASALKSASRETDLVARYGGEEFALIIPQADIRAAAALADRARAVVEAKILKRRKTNETLGSVTASFGVAQYRPGESIQSLIERADAALYRAKAEGRNRVSKAPTA